MANTNQQARIGFTEIPVRSYHLDAFQHVNNARYLEFLEEARWRFFDEDEVLQKAVVEGFGIVVINNNISYKYPATVGQVLEIQTYFEKMGRTSIVFHQKIYLKGTDTLVVDAIVTFVAVDQKTQKAIEIPDEIRNVLTR